jgi:hypothetical protein
MSDMICDYAELHAEIARLTSALEVALTALRDAKTHSEHGEPFRAEEIIEAALNRIKELTKEEK